MKCGDACIEGFELEETKAIIQAMEACGRGLP